MLLLFCGLVQLSSKSAIISLVIIVIFIFPWFVLSRKYRWSFIAICTLSILFFIIAITNIDSLNKRLFTDFKNDLTKRQPQADKNEYRIARWQIAWDLGKQAPIAGHGAGTEKDLLKQKYFEKKLYSSYLNELDAHNQYLSFFIDAGIIGLLGYLYSLFIGFKYALKNKDILFFSFMILIVIVSCAEDILKANKGIFFYSFFFSFFFFSNTDKK
jgi:O-antigen ligase